MAGGIAWEGNNTYYLNTGVYWWAGSPYNFDEDRALVWYVVDNGDVGNEVVGYEHGARAVVSLRLGYTISGGNGSVTTPYIVS